jgi:predicted  nucleic acid-binding Zn-ribbon protein
MNLAGTEFVVVWQGTSMSGSGSDIYSQPFLRESYSSDATIAFWSQLVYQTTTITRVSGTTSSSSTTTTGDPNAPYTNSSIYTSISTRDGDTITISTTSHYGATIGETLVNTTRNGAQLYPSVAVSYNGSYVVTWSGNGDRTNQSDDSGVFYQRFGTDALAAGGEMRANIGTTGDQKNASVAMDASGNFVIAWTGVGSSYGETDIFRHVSLNVTPTVDLVGPIVTDVRLSDGTRIFDGDTIQPASPGVSQLVVVFSEKMYTCTNTDGSPSLHSVLNLQNWQLSRDGNEIDNVIQAISFGLNPLTHKYEAVLTFRNPLAVGNYTMTAMDTMWDAALNLANGGGSYVSNALDGDYDATPGTNATYTGQPGFSIRFTATTSATANAETRVNTSTGYTDEFSTTYASGYAQESSARTVAVDHSGDFAVVWTRYGADGVTDPSSPNYDPNAASNAGVYMRLYDRNNNPLTGEVLVNTFTKGNQINGTIAMDADGDFVVVWASDSQDPDGSWGIYGQRFNSIGQKIDGEFRVNTNTANDQVSPAVAMNSSGAFVVVWATKGEAFGYFNDIHGQIFNRDGQRVGNEFLVNSENIPSNNFVTGGTELHPAVSMNDKGQFIVSWEAVTGQTNGVVTGTEVMMRTFGSDGTPLQFYNDANDDQGSTTKEFIVDGVGDSNGNSDQAVFTARNPQVVLDNNGNFIIVYEYAFDLGDDVFTGPVYGVYYRRGHLDHGSWDTLPTQANQPAFFGDSSLGGPQVNPTVALDANNNFVIAWNGPGATVDPLNSNVVTEVDLQGVFIRRFVSSNVIFSSDIPVTPQTRVNSTSGGDQKFPSVAMTPDGDVIAVWSGNGVGDRNGIYFRRYQQTTDTAGPELTDFLLPDGTPINTNQQVGQALSAIVLTFDEAMFDNATHTGNAVTNPANYKLLKNGVEVVGGISQVYYGLNMANTLSGQYGISSPKTNKYEVVLIVDDNGAGSGVMPLIDGQYQIVAKNSLRDAVGNPLNSTGMNPNGNVMSQSFNVTIGAGQETQVANSTNGGKQTGSQSVAGDADGDHVVVWTNTNSGQQGVYFKLYSVIWTVNTATNTRTASYSESESGEVRITSDVTATGAAVARDADGDFVVTWTAQNGANGTDIFAQQFDAKGVAKSGIFRVNTYTTSAQSAPAVAMGTEGDFVITWESLGQDESGYGIYAQRFDRNGVRLGGTNEIQTINFVDAWTGNFSLLWNDGTTDRATAVINHHGNMAATTAAIKKAMADIGASVDVVVSGSHLNIIFTGKSASVNQSQLRVNPANLVKTGGTTNSARIDISTIQDGDTGEFRVNDTTLSDQTDPSIAMDKSGNFVISWTSSVQNTQGAWNTDIYAKKFTSSGSYWNGNNVSVTNGASPNANLPPNASIGPLISTVDNPTSHQVPSGAGYDGVVQVNFDVLGLYMGYGSGVLLAGSNVILTAAHVATYEGTFIPIESQFMNVTFDTATGPVTMGVSQVIVHPGWLGNLADGNDIALLVLDGDAPSGVKGYDIYRGSDEVGKIGSMYGYGITGTGANGSTGDSNNLKYSGQNRIDATSSIFGSGFSNTFLVSDFDSGLPANDAMGIYYNVHDLGLGVNEAGLSSGDSGGPMFVNGKIAGIASFGMTYGGSQDAVPGLNTSLTLRELDRFDHRVCRRRVLGQRRRRADLGLPDRWIRQSDPRRGPRSRRSLRQHQRRSEMVVRRHGR